MLADGTLHKIYAYNAYGLPQCPIESGQPNCTHLDTGKDRFGYTGQIWLPELGMWYYKARVYSPTLGRFLQTDPIGYEDRTNLYIYGRNDPINKFDPNGHRPVDVWVFRESKSRKAGHIMITEHDSERVIVSQFPDKSVSTIFSDRRENQTLNFADTVASEGGFEDSTVYIIFVPNDRGFDRAAQAEVGKPFWDTIPQNNPREETNCSFSAYTVLRAGGVDLLSDSPATPAQLEMQIRTQLQQDKNGIWRNRVNQK